MVDKVTPLPPQKKIKLSFNLNCALFSALDFFTFEEGAECLKMSVMNYHSLLRNMP
jgi:hypothetical protein